MVGNTFGHIFRVTTWGESHGKAVGCVVDGCPAGLDISSEVIQRELDRRKPGGRLATKRKEEDKVEILSGVFEGKTLGTPISMLIWNKDVDSRPYEEIKDLLRPGHADYTYLAKFGIRDWRGGGRASARETAARVAAGAIAKHLLARFGVKVGGYAKEIAGVSCNVDGMSFEEIVEKAEKSDVRCPDSEAAKLMEERIIEARREGDSVGGVVEVIVKNPPAGLGEPVFMKLDAYIAYAVMGIPAVKGVEIGAGFEAARMKGSEHNDPIVIKNGRIGFATNNAGGILGGVSNGDDIIVRAAIKPTPSISKPQRTVNFRTMKEEEIVVKGRHDPCIVPRAVPVVEAMVSLAIADAMMLQGLIPRCLQG
ncbi:chorismate synthase [Archaeoglobus veneficus]|uniref:Chorismate synthase n=1 Tax=Archaeoglobus veneficus (strain DSM 11195 / SNP6) TaxID=693661 RepID=F2KNM1_ARCVS|nr:chorismate synthase [Archaeoglobus veneficus]AEA46249.1 chorismate synthase [Archaeoglobus veneficus SNP6]